MLQKYHHICVALLLSFCVSDAIPIPMLSNPNATFVSMISDNIPVEYNKTTIAHVWRCDSIEACPIIEMGNPEDRLIMRAAEVSKHETYILFCSIPPYNCGQHNATIHFANMKASVNPHTIINKALESIRLVDDYVIADWYKSNLWHLKSDQFPIREYLHALKRRYHH